MLLVACEVTGALHSEVLAGASTMHFMVEWEKFIATRGRPNWVVSDNGTNFKSKTNTADSANLTSVDWLEVERRELRDVFISHSKPFQEFKEARGRKDIVFLSKLLAEVVRDRLPQAVDLIVQRIREARAAKAAGGSWGKAAV